MLHRTVGLGRFAGCPVRVHWSALVVVLLIALTSATAVLPAAAPHHAAVTYWLVSVPVALLFLGALLVHEMAHALVARRHGLYVWSVTVWMLGGVTEVDDEPRDARADFQVAIAGPVTSLTAAVALVLLAAQGILLGLPVVLTSAVLWVAVVNVLVALFNLLPAEPLDGGRVLRAVLWKVLGDRARAQRTTIWSGRTLGVVLALVGLVEIALRERFGGASLLLLGTFLVWAAGNLGRTPTVGADRTSRSARLTQTRDSS